MAKKKSTYRKAVKKKEPLSKSQSSSSKRAKTSDASSPFNEMLNWLIVLVAFLPVLFSREAMDPTVTPRYIFLSLFCFLFAGYFFGIKKTPVPMPMHPLTKWVFYLGLGFGVWATVSMLFSTNLQEGYYGVARHFLNIGLLFMVMMAVFREESNLSKFLKAIVIVSLIQSAVGIAQHYGATLNIPGTVKPYGFMSNRNLFGSAQAFLIPFLIYIWYKNDKGWKYLASLAIGLAVFSVIISETRSAWLATCAIFLLAIPLLIIYSTTSRKKWQRGTWVGATGIALVFVLILVTDMNGAFTKSIFSRAKSLAAPTTSKGSATGSVTERIIIWGQCLEVLADHPILGVGPGNWKIAIPAYGSEGLVNATGTRVRLRPHNVYLHVADETGIPGILLYLGMWVLLAYLAIRIIIRPSTEDRKTIAILMLGGLAAVAVDSIFSFPTDRIEHSLYMMLMAGILLGIHEKAFSTESSSSRLLPKWILPVALVLIGFNGVLGYAKYNYEVHMNRANAYKKKGNFKQVIIEGNEAKTVLVSMSPIGDPIELHTAEAYKGLKDYEKAISESNIALGYHPNSARILNNLGTIYTEQQQYAKAIETYERALKITPQYDILLKNLAINYLSNGDYQKCIQTLDKFNIEGDEYFTKVLQDAKAKLAQ